MHLLRDHNPGAYNVRVSCLACGRLVKLADAVIDRDGPAFQAYYHPVCAPAGPVERCEREGCEREECKS